MLIGLIADSHDNLQLIDKAVKVLNEKNVELVLHVGDFVSPFVVSKLKDLHCRVIGVFGNNDGDRELLKKRFNETSNCTIYDCFAQVKIEGYKIAMMHGNEPELLNVIVDSGYFNAVIYGHSHKLSIERKGKTLNVNPGELCGYLTGKATIALLDTIRDEATIIDI